MNDIPARAAAVALARYPGRPEVAAEVERRAREAMTQARIRAARDGLAAVTMGDALKSPAVREAEALARLADGVAQDMPAAVPSASPAARPEAVAAPAAPDAPDISSAPAVVHRVGNRAHPLDGVIAEARRRAVRDDWMTVWGELTHMAECPDRPAPLMGYAPGDGLQVRSDDPDGFRYYSKDAFRQHWRRRNKG